MKRTDVYCPTCGVWVGWDWPDTWDEYYGGEPGFFEGDDTWRDDTGRVYCSEACLKESNPEPEEEDNG